MSGFSAKLRDRFVLSLLVRYCVAVASVGLSLGTVETLEHLGVRDPRSSILLAGIAVSVWYCGAGPGVLAILLSAIALHHVLRPNGPWYALGPYDLPYFLAFLLFGILIYQFSRTRKHAERMVLEARSQLEFQVKERTAELLWLNTEYRTILDAVPIGIALFGPDRIVRRCSLAYERMLGVQPGELIGQRAPLPPGEEDAWPAREDALRRGERFIEYETTRIRKDGSIFPATITLVPLFDDHGIYVGFVGAIVDSTDRRAKEAKLRMLSELVQHSPDFIGVADMNLDMIFINPAGQELFGVDSDEDVRRSNAPEYFATEQRAGIPESLLPKLLSEGSLRVELAGRNLKTGRTFPVLCSSFVIRDPQTGEPWLLASVNRDVSDLKRTEDELRRRAAYLTEAQNISHTGSWSWNITEGKGEWSDEVYQILGLPPGSLIPGPNSYLEWVFPEDRELTRKVLLDAIERRVEFDQQHRILRPDDSVRHVRQLGRPFATTCGTTEFIVTMMDVTEQWAARTELEYALSRNTSLLAEVRALEEKASRENISLKEQNLLLKREFNRDTTFKEIIGASAALERTLAQVAQVAPTNSNVLISGETGTGKELIAQAIHQASRRADKPFIAVNCAAVAPGLFASELFGHEKGAFTGADQKRIGRFELAEGGTLFLDEVGDIPIETQVVLLRVLQERVFERVGGNTPIQSDVRVLAATNRDLKSLIKEGRFRSDLFYRLNVFPIEVPPLRHRKEDIRTLVTYFVQKAARKLDKRILDIDANTMDRLEAYQWPGNIRELQNLMERAVIISDGDLLVVDGGMLAAGEHRSAYGTYAEEMETFERRLIEDALATTHGRVAGPSGAAAILGIPPSTLSSRITALKIDKRRLSGD